MNKNEAEQFNNMIKPMFREVYYRLLDDLHKHDTSSVIYKHHIDVVREGCRHYEDWDYSSEEPNQIVADYIASMTDDYFIELYKHLFPDSGRIIEYHSYFEE